MNKRARALLGGAVVVLAFVVVTIWLRADHLLYSAAQMTSYGTVLLAVGTIGLAVGAIGTYMEQRRTSGLQKDQLADQRAQIAEQKLQLVGQRTAEMAQIVVTRLAQPGDWLKVIVRNDSTRAIGNVYVWATVEGITGTYPAAVQDDENDDPKNARMVRGMKLLEEPVRQWVWRTIPPGRQERFLQLVLPNGPQRELPSSFHDSAVTAFAQFTDTEGVRWQCDEDGNVSRAPAALREEGPPGSAIR